MKNTILNMVIYTILIITIFVLVSALFNQKDLTSEAKNIATSLSDTLKTERMESGQMKGRISVLETQSAKMFIDMDIKDLEIKHLQDEVKRYKKNLKNQGSVTTIGSITKIDTIWSDKPIVRDTIILSEEVLIDSIKNDWINVTYGFIRGQSMFYLSSLKNEYTVVIGRESQGIFKLPKTFVEITSYNPYTEISHLRTYNVKSVDNKRWGIGFNIGYGASLTDGYVRIAPQLSIGLNYNLIMWR